MDTNSRLLTLSCVDVNCNFSCRLSRVLKQPVVRIGALTHCPMCGGNAVSSQDSAQDYWESLAAEYGLTVEEIQLIYQCWDQTTHHKFSDHVAELMQEVQDEAV